MVTDAITTRQDGVVFRVRLTPRSDRDRLDGWVRSEGYLRARVRAVPERGKANEALIALLAEYLRIPKSAVVLAAGGAGRSKTIAAKGDVGALARKLEALGEAK